jgi:addiction module toxin, txe/yoeB family
MGFRCLGRLSLLAIAGQKNLKKINKLLKDISRNPFEGIGKPEPLKENLTGFWSRRIDEEHRLVYAVEDERVIIFACRGHYDG